MDFMQIEKALNLNWELRKKISAYSSIAPGSKKRLLKILDEAIEILENEV